MKEIREYWYCYKTYQKPELLFEIHKLLLYRISSMLLLQRHGHECLRSRKHLMTRLTFEYLFGRYFL